MKRIAAALVVLATCCGCASFKTTQYDTSYDDAGKPLRTVKTVTRASTLFDSDSQLANLETTQDVETGQTQSTKVGSLNQKSTSDSIDKIAEIIGRGLIQALTAGATP